MSKTTKKNDVVEENELLQQEKPKVKRFSKKAYVNAVEYAVDAPLLDVLLEDGIKYSKQEVDELLLAYKNKEVKE